MINSSDDYFHHASLGLDKNCGIITIGQFLRVCGFFCSDFIKKELHNLKNDFQDRERIFLTKIYTVKYNGLKIGKKKLLNQFFEPLVFLINYVTVVQFYQYHFKATCHSFYKGLVKYSSPRVSFSFAKPRKPMIPISNKKSLNFVRSIILDLY